VIWIPIEEFIFIFFDTEKVTCVCAMENIITESPTVRKPLASACLMVYSSGGKPLW